MTSSKRTEFLNLFRDFVSSSLDTPDGKDRLDVYRHNAETGRQNYHDILAAAGRGEDITEMVLLKLLPHAENTRAKSIGSWVHSASGFNDARQLLSAGRGVARKDFPQAARAILDFIKRCVNNPAHLAEECAAFDAIPYIKGLQTGALTPILNAIRPDDFVLINTSPLKVLEHFTGTKYGPKLIQYPKSNPAARRLISEVADDMLRIVDRESVSPSYLFDMFSRWLVVDKKYFEEGEKGKMPKKETPKKERKETPVTVEFVRDRFREFYPEESDRRVCAEMLADAIVYAHSLSETNWSCTCRQGRNPIRLNVGRFYAIDLRSGNVDLPMERTLLTEKEEEALAPYLKPLDVLKSAPPETVEAAIPADLIAKLRPVVRPAHRRWIEWATASAVGNNIWWYAHQSAVSQFLSEYLGREVPNPAYWSESLPELELEPESEPLPEPEPNPIVSLESIAEDTGIAIGDLERWVRAIKRKKQAVLYGPPGTGKTYLAEHLARHLVGGGDGLIEIVQFHPAYSYEEFIQGIRPERASDGALDYRMKAGLFLKFCAEAENRSGTSVLIIDEINRANLARVFGELMYLLEYRGRRVALAGGETFHIPENVRILGTMNTADRSIALVDHALRRRFAFLELRPEYEVLRVWHRRHNPEFPVDALVAELRRLNIAIDDPHYEVGISFFMQEDIAEAIPDIWRMEIEPYLQEYFFDQASKFDMFRWERIGAKIVGGTSS